MNCPGVFEKKNFNDVSLYIPNPPTPGDYDLDKFEAPT